jgi:predicted metalloprotease with PDZ domain
VATGLDSIAPQTYVANSMDQVYDSPILMGKLNELPSFIIQGKRHRFIGYEMGNFDGTQLMKQVEKIILATGQLMGEYPYNHYTFIGIGPGNGGIEQLNSTAISFTGDEFSKGGKRTLSFLAHEYFHHYNVKRIRPIELGPLEAELKAACEKIAGKNLDELFSLIYTTKPIDYASYFSKAGLSFQLIPNQAKAENSVHLTENPTASAAEKSILTAFFQ